MFLFDPTDTSWSGQSRFNNWLAKACRDNGLEMTIVETSGSDTTVVYFKGINPLNEVKNMENNKVSLDPKVTIPAPKLDERRKQPGSQLREMAAMPLNNARERDFKKGKLLKSKGYIKR